MANTEEKTCCLCPLPYERSCSCSGSAEQFCLFHADEHMNSTSHLSTPSHDIIEAKGKCCKCDRPPEVLCCCTFPIPLFCSEHIKKHQQEKGCKRLDLSIENAKKLETRKNQMEVMKKLLRLTLLEVEIEEETDKIQECIELSRKRCIQICHDARKYDYENARKLMALKEEIKDNFEKAKDKFIREICEENVELKGDLHGVLGKLASSGREVACSLFAYNDGFVENDLSRILGIEWETKVENGGFICQKLALLEEQKASVYSPWKNKWEEISYAKLKIDRYSSYIFLPNGDLFVCGSNINRSPSKQTSIISSDGSTITKKGGMCMKRYQHSLCYANGYVYAFGGINISGCAVACCEKILATGLAWIPLRDMKTARHSFGMCPHNENIYVLGGQTTTCEKFNCATGQFEMMEISVETGPTIAFIERGFLSVLSKHFLTRFRLSDLKQTDTDTNRCEQFCPSLTRPYLFNGLLIYTAPGCDKLKCIDLTTMSDCIITSSS